MPDQLTTNEDGLRLFFTDDIYLVNEPIITWGLPQDPESASASAPLASSTVLPKDPEISPKADFQFLGSNKRNILFLVFDEENAVSNEKGRELLRKIVKSINLISEDFALVNYAKYKGSSFQELCSFFKSSLIFSFGVAPIDLGLQDHPQNTVVMEGAVKMIFTNELRKLDTDQVAKKALWAVLQKLAI